MTLEGLELVTIGLNPKALDQLSYPSSLKLQYIHILIDMYMMMIIFHLINKRYFIRKVQIKKSLTMDEFRYEILNYTNEETNYEAQ